MTSFFKFSYKTTEITELEFDRLVTSILKTKTENFYKDTGSNTL